MCERWQNIKVVEYCFKIKSSHWYFNKVLDYRHGTHYNSISVDPVISVEAVHEDFPQVLRRGGGAPTPKVRLFFQLFAEKLHENERIWTTGARVAGAPLDPLMVMNFLVQFIVQFKVNFTFPPPPPRHPAKKFQLHY